MLKLLENCDRNASFAALLALLVEPPRGVAGEGDLEARWSDLLVKCLIKITKAFGGGGGSKGVLRRRSCVVEPGAIVLERSTDATATQLLHHL